jgi:hypothetical protein
MALNVPTKLPVHNKACWVKPGFKVMFKEFRRIKQNL